MSNLDAFLSKSGWADASLHPIANDWSARRFYRVQREGGETAIVIAYPDNPDLYIPPGHYYEDVVTMTPLMARASLPVPELLAFDDAERLILVQDFGKTTIHDDFNFYLKSVDLAIKIFKTPCNNWPLIRYRDGHVYKALDRFMHHSLRCADLIPLWMAAWDSLMEDLGDWPCGLTHMDFHAGNLLQRADGSIGMIDHQGARLAPLGYDLVNLVEDARIDLSPDWKRALISRFIDGFPEQRQDFSHVFDLLALQFHLRIFGQADYLAQEKGRADLLSYKPSLQRRILSRLDKPAFYRIRQIIEDVKPEFMGGYHV